MITTKTTHLLKTLIAGAALTVMGVNAFAVAIDATAAMQGTAGSAGLAGSFWQEPHHSTNYDVNVVKNDMLSARTGSFVSTQVNYNGVDLSSITAFLGADGGSYSGPAGNLDDGIVGVKGFLRIDAPMSLTFHLRHDDVGGFSIGNQTLISQTCCGTDTVTADFSTAGFYAIDAFFANTATPNSEGGAVFTLTADSAMPFYQDMAPVPEPETYAMLLAGLGVLGCVTRRRKTL